METNTLKYTVVKSFREKGITYKVIATIKLHDECKNGTCSWSITGTLQQKKGNGRFYDIGHGCIHEEILKAFPKLKMFVDLHLCDWRGTPLYPVENGYYFLQEDKKQAKEYLRVTDEEMEILSKCDNKEYFKYQLFALSIVKRWQAESKKAIQALEELTGDVWVNPYKESEERHRFVLSDEEREEMEGKILSRYYTESSIQERKEAERIAKIEKRKNEVIKTFEKRINKATKEKDVKLAILGAGLLSDNYIYYVEGNNVVFNYYSYHDKVTEEEYNNMLKNIDYSLLPEGIKFEFK
jgi:hypothetical protein|uniref:Uncharacterized protein n=1 Tax=Herelleviridae sp. cttEB8 TaxID=2825832 RepID=A0A8S5P6T3_9CAUD|nr:MAG TPA: hypothetical protein [Herelleviridae sp. cttEB8]